MRQLPRHALAQCRQQRFVSECTTRSGQRRARTARILAAPRRATRAAGSMQRCALPAGAGAADAPKALGPLILACRCDTRFAKSSPTVVISPMTSPLLIERGNSIVAFRCRPEQGKSFLFVQRTVSGGVLRRRRHGRLIWSDAQWLRSIAFPSLLNRESFHIGAWILFSSARLNSSHRVSCAHKHPAGRGWARITGFARP